MGILLYSSSNGVADDATAEPDRLRYLLHRSRLLVVHRPRRLGFSAVIFDRPHPSSYGRAQPQARWEAGDRRYFIEVFMVIMSVTDTAPGEVEIVALTAA